MGRNPGFGEYFQGRIDEVGIYNRALAPAEIQAIYNAGGAGRCKTATPCPAIAISPASLSGFARDRVYSQTFSASSVAAPYTSSPANGPLPPPLTLPTTAALPCLLTPTRT